MAYDFPTAPTVGQIFEDATSGTKYIWSGTVWDLAAGGDLSDFVLKAGDEMTGTLSFAARSAAEHAILIKNDTGVETMKLSGSSSTHAGLIEFFGNDALRSGYIGYGDNVSVSLAAEGGRNWNVSGGLYLSSGGVHWGSNSSVTDPLDFSKGICLYGYGGSSKFGFTITGGTLNYVVQTTSNQHVFRVGSEDVMNIKTDGVRIPGGNLHVSGNVYIRDNDSFDLSNGYYIRKVSGAQNMFFHGGQSSAFFTFHITGFGDAFVIDKVGSTGNSVNVTAPDALTLGTELGVTPDTDRGVDVMKVMAAMLAKVKLLEARIEELEAA